MVVQIQNLIAAINPELYCKPLIERNDQRINLIAEVKRQVRDHGYRAAAEIAQARESQALDFESPEALNPFSLGLIGNPIEQHTLVYDAFGENVTAVYFWILDYLEKHVDRLLGIEKIVDNFVSSPGSGHFWDMETRAIRLQERAAKYLDATRRILENLPSAIRELKELKRQIELDPESVPGTAIRAGDGSLATHSELRRRFQLKQAWLEGQLNMARLNVQWLKPSLRTLGALNPKSTTDPGLVNGFNSSLMELVLLSKAEYNLREDIDAGLLPKSFARKKARGIFPILIVELRFRGVPDKGARGGYVFRGRSEVVISSFALNEDELAILKRELERDDLEILFEGLLGSNAEALATLEQELAEVMRKPTDAQDSKRLPGAADSEDINPFSALWSLFTGWGATEDTTDGTELKPDSMVEKVLRNQALLKARRDCRQFYNDFKEWLGMPVMTG